MVESSSLTKCNRCKLWGVDVDQMMRIDVFDVVARMN